MKHHYDLSVRKELKQKFRGPIASVKTPFNKDGSIDYPSLGNFVDTMIDDGAAAIVLTMGDSLYTVLTDTEIAELTKKTVELTNGRVPVVAADKQWWTGKAVEFARYSREVGADLMMVANPDWANSSTTDSLVEHYTAVSAAIPVMVLTMSFKLRPESFGLEVIRRLKEGAPGVMAIKDDHPSGAFGRRMCHLLGGDWVVMMGGTYEYLMEKYHYGVDCSFATPLMFRPELATEFFVALEAGNYDRVIEIITDYEMPFFECIRSFKGGFSAGAAASLELRGIQKRHRRPPYVDATDEEVERLKAFLAGLP